MTSDNHQRTNALIVEVGLDRTFEAESGLSLNSGACISKSSRDEL